VYGVQPMSDYVARAMAPTRFAMSLIALFALVAMALAAVGLYGVLSYLTGQRAHEFGVRLALGAGRAEIFRLVVTRGLMMAGLGIVVGTLAALWLTRIIAKLLIGVRPTDPLTFAAVAAFLLIVVFVACLVPARRAMRVDPLVSLRQD
jgi:ABC-type antimicrobial peptide transport system permease subunit